jgi:hypothetical protein
MFFISLIRDFPFNFINCTPALFDTLLEALLYNSSHTIPRFHLIINNFPVGSACHFRKKHEKNKVLAWRIRFFSLFWHTGTIDLHPRIRFGAYKKMAILTVAI